MKITRIVLAEDHECVRQSICAWLANFPEFEVVAQVERGADLEAAIQEHHPDLLLLDLHMERGFDPTQAVPQLRQIRPDLKVLILTAVNNPRWVIAMMDAGADGYAHKRDRLPTLTTAIRSVMAGQIWLSERLGQALVEAEWVKDVRDKLSKRELRILEKLAAGQPVKTIALSIKVSPRKLYRELAELRGKLHVQSNSHAVALAVRLGLID